MVGFMNYFFLLGISFVSLGIELSCYALKLLSLLHECKTARRPSCCFYFFGHLGRHRDKPYPTLPYRTDGEREPVGTATHKGERAYASRSALLRRSLEILNSKKKSLFIFQDFIKIRAEFLYIR